MKKVLLGLFVSIWLLVSSGIPVLATASTANGAGAATGVKVPQISAPSSILVEAESGQVLYKKDEKLRLHISAACKLMTVLIAAENSDLHANVTISSDSVDSEGSALSLVVGAKYELEDLLYGIMLTSANDAATAVAEYTSGDTGKFVEQMNATAVKLNMKNTHFTNPTGLLDNNQYTTAEDISKLIRYAIGNTEFNKIFSARARPWSSGDTVSKVLTSPNKLFYSYDGVEGGKTGYNKKEQQTAITTAYRDGMRLICVVLDSPEKDLYMSSASLFDYGFNNFRKSVLVHKGDILKTGEFQGNKINLISQNDVNYVHPIGESFIQAYQATSDLKQPVLKTVPAGNASYVLQDGTVINVSLYPETEITQPESFWTKARKTMHENKDIFMLVLFLLAIEFIMILYHLFRLFKKLFIKLLKQSHS